MKTKKKITAAIFGAVSLLVLTVAASYGDVVCNAGKLVGAGSGINSAAPAQRYVMLRCNIALTGWTANTTRRFKLAATHDPDGKYATALTALALTNETVRFIVSGTGAADSFVYLLDIFPPATL